MKLNCGMLDLISGTVASSFDVTFVPSTAVPEPDLTSFDLIGLPYEVPFTGVSLSSGLLIALSDVLAVSEDSSEALSDDSSPDEFSWAVFGGSLQHPPGLPQEPLLRSGPSRLLSDR